ncbi:MAG: hypothetical protein HXX81_01840 [Campylobacterales bacterium]|nr:hypothetical protein [Campylobacterales bacterium]
MLFDWLLLTSTILFVIFLFAKMFFFKSMARKEEKNNVVMKLTLQEAEIMIRKYQLQLQRALGNIDILTEELTKLRNEMKVLKSRNSQYRMESDKLRSRIKELESKIEALL